MSILDVVELDDLERAQAIDLGRERVSLLGEKRTNLLKQRLVSGHSGEFEEAEQKKPAARTYRR